MNSPGKTTNSGVDNVILMIAVVGGRRQICCV